MTISCQQDGRPPQPVRPWKSGRVHLAEGSNVVVLELPYSTEFGWWDSRKFASGVRKYGKFSHFLTHLVVYGGQRKKQILSSLSTANVHRLSRVKSRVKVSGTCVQPFQRYWGFGVFGGLWVFLGCLGVFGVLGFWSFLGCFGVFRVFWGFRVFWDFGVFGGLWVFCVFGVFGCFGVFGDFEVLGVLGFWGF